MHSQSKRSFRPLVRWALRLGIPVVLVFLFLVSERIRAAWELHKVMTEIQRSGGIMDPLALAPSYPEEEASSLEDWKPILEAVSQRPNPYVPEARWDFPRAMADLSLGTAIPSWKLDVLKVNPREFTWQDLEAVSHGVEDLWKALDPVLAKPYLNLGWDWSSEKACLQSAHESRFLSIKSVYQWLNLDVLLHLRNNQPQVACQKLTRLILFLDRIRQQPLFIYQLVQSSMLEVALNLTWATLAHPSLPQDSLEVLERALLDMDPWPSLKTSLQIQRAWEPGFMRQMKASTKSRENYLSGFNVVIPQEEAPGPLYQWLWGYVWADFDEARFLKIESRELQMLDAMQLGWHRSENQALLVDFHALATKQPTQGLDRWRYSSGRRHGETLFSLLVTIQTRLALTVQAVRLERFRIAHGTYPESLEVLDAWAQNSSPKDPFGEGPLRYRLLEDGTFLLYSVGPDGLDGEGDPTPHAPGELADWLWHAFMRPDVNGRGRDWVWPQVRKHP